MFRMIKSTCTSDASIGGGGARGRALVTALGVGAGIAGEWDRAVGRVLRGEPGL